MSVLRCPLSSATLVKPHDIHEAREANISQGGEGLEKLKGTEITPPTLLWRE
jgi:hypothetical protein